MRSLKRTDNEAKLEQQCYTQTKGRIPIINLAFRRKNTQTLNLSTKVEIPQKAFKKFYNKHSMVENVWQ